MNPIFLKEFNTVHDDLMDQLIRENGIRETEPEKEFSFKKWLEEIAAKQNEQ